MATPKKLAPEPQSAKLSISLQVHKLRKGMADLTARIDALEMALGGTAPSATPEKDKA